MSAPSFRERLLRHWYMPRRTSLTTALAPAEWLFRGLVALRRLAYRAGIPRATRLPVPVIVVGNITVGGTGKTPLVAWLVAALATQGFTPGIVARGYGSDVATPRPVDPAGDAEANGDEPLLLSQSGTPVWIGSDRVAAARGLLMKNPGVDVIVSDDGLQHYALDRDFEIVVVDCARGLGNGALLPAGPLREPASRMNTVDAIVINGEASRIPPAAAGGVPAYSMMLRGARFESLVDPGRYATSASFSAARVHAIAGIGNPQRFFDALRALGLDPVRHPFPDHHRFVAGDLALPDADFIVMTTKDAIKCRRFADARMWSLPVTAEVDPGLIERILEKIDGRKAA